MPTADAAAAQNHILLNGSVSTVENMLLADTSHPRFGRRKARLHQNLSSLLQSGISLSVLEPLNSWPPPPPAAPAHVCPAMRAQAVMEDVKLEVGVYLGTREAPK